MSEPIGTQHWVVLSVRANRDAAALSLNLVFADEAENAQYEAGNTVQKVPVTPTPRSHELFHVAIARSHERVFTPGCRLHGGGGRNIAERVV